MPRNNSKSRKEERRISAEVRQEEWDALTTDEKLARVQSRLDKRDDTDEDSILHTNEHRKLVRASD